MACALGGYASPRSVSRSDHEPHLVLRPGGKLSRLLRADDGRVQALRSAGRQRPAQSDRGQVGIRVVLGQSRGIYRTARSERWQRQAISDSRSDGARSAYPGVRRSEEHTSELQSLAYLVCRLLLEKKKKKTMFIRI